jgi:hypothetical protein
MNCSDVETTLVGMTRKEAIDPDLRNRALVHAQDCHHCSELLTAENQLSGWLDAVRTAMQADAASPAVEAALLKEFRAQSPASGNPASGIHVRNAWNLWRFAAPKWVYAAAAAVLLAIGLFVTIGLMKRDNSDNNRALDVARPAGTNEKVNEKTAQPPEKNAAVAGPKQVDKPSGQPRKRRPNRFYDAVGKNGAPDSRRNEIATDFLPVAGFNDPADLESGQILRVELPRSALLSFGLPVDPDRASERVKADVLVGGDGVARAIRFVSGSFEYGR